APEPSPGPAPRRRARGADGRGLPAGRHRSQPRVRAGRGRRLPRPDGQREDRSAGLGGQGAGLRRQRLGELADPGGGDGASGRAPAVAAADRVPARRDHVGAADRAPEGGVRPAPSGGRAPRHPQRLVPLGSCCRRRSHRRGNRHRDAPARSSPLAVGGPGRGLRRPHGAEPDLSRGPLALRRGGRHVPGCDPGGRLAGAAPGTTGAPAIEDQSRRNGIDGGRPGRGGVV
ncbi:MAG: hypothetical protein AVDCRST_MAG10-2253, partial [uncultured Acidimicrobiales bacterium]